MTIKPIDKERLRAAIWRVEKFLENLSDIDKLLFALEEMKITSTYKIGPKAKETKYSSIEEVITKRERLQTERRVGEIELQLARFDLTSELDRLYTLLWPETIHIIRDNYIYNLDPGSMKLKYGNSYLAKIKRVTG